LNGTYILVCEVFWGEMEYVLIKLYSISTFDVNYTTTSMQLRHSWETVSSQLLTTLPRWSRSNPCHVH